MTAGLPSVHAFPMRVRAHVLGTLNLFMAAPRPLSDADVLVAQALAHAATLALLLGLRPAAQPQTDRRGQWSRRTDPARRGPRRARQPEPLTRQSPQQPASATTDRARTADAALEVVIGADPPPRPDGEPQSGESPTGVCPTYPLCDRWPGRQGGCVTDCSGPW
jgi:hypothetical protein